MDGEIEHVNDEVLSIWRYRSGGDTEPIMKQSEQLTNVYGKCA